MDAIQLVVAQLARPFQGGWLRALMRRRSASYEPQWSDTAFGRLCQGLFWEAELRWRTARRLSRVWTQMHYVLGCLAVVLAAVAGFAGLTELLGRTAAGAVSLAAAVAGALATFLKTDEMRQHHTTLMAEWDSFRDAVTIVWETRPTPTGSPSIDPDGWQVLVGALDAHAKDLRRGDVKDWRAPKWKGAGQARAGRGTQGGLGIK